MRSCLHRRISQLSLAFLLVAGASVWSAARPIHAADPVELGIARVIGTNQPVANRCRIVRYGREFNLPVVIMGPVGSDAETPAFARICRIAGDRFSFAIEEWFSQDRVHPQIARLPFIVMEAGRPARGPDGSLIVAGLTSRVRGAEQENWQRAEFGVRFTQALRETGRMPLVFAQVSTFNGPEPVVARIRNVTARGFEVAVQEESDPNTPGHRDEWVSWIAIAGATADGARQALIAAGTSPIDIAAAIDIPAPPAAGDLPPILLAALQTFNDDATATLRHRLVNGATRVHIEGDGKGPVPADETVGHALFRPGTIMGTILDPIDPDDLDFVEAEPEDATRDDLEREGFVLQDAARSYLVHMPATADQPSGGRLPLVIVMHGNGGSAVNTAKYSGFDAIADREGFIAVYPDARDRRWNYGRALAPSHRMPFAPNGHLADDVAFLRMIIDRFVADGRVDPARVYVTGISRGGMMTFGAMCRLSNQVAAGVSLIAPMTTPQTSDCRAIRPMPMMILAGTKDNPHYHGHDFDNGRLLSVPQTVNFWYDHNGCTSVAQNELADINPDDGSTITLVRGLGCRDGTETAFYRIEGGGHRTPRLARPPTVNAAGETEPGDEEIIEGLNRDVNAAELAWAFMNRFHR